VLCILVSCWVCLCDEWMGWCCAFWCRVGCDEWMIVVVHFGVVLGVLFMVS